MMQLTCRQSLVIKKLCRLVDQNNMRCFHQSDANPASISSRRIDGLQKKHLPEDQLT